MPWSPSLAWVVDEQTDEAWSVVHPQEKVKNADVMRRTIEPLEQVDTSSHGDDQSLPPLPIKSFVVHAKGRCDPLFPTPSSITPRLHQSLVYREQISFVHRDHAHTPPSS
jgi:hypothetical protein